MSELPFHVLRLNFSVCFIASTPGSFHEEESFAWGHGYLQRLLKEHAVEEKNEEGVTVMQASSIGSLGPNPCSWFLDEIGKSMGVENEDALDVKVVISHWNYFKESKVLS